MSITLTELAATEVKKGIEEQKLEDSFVRIGVTGCGCSGLNYSLAFDNSFDENNDLKYEQHGVVLVVDKKSEIYLIGTKIDFYVGLDKRGFIFNNPNATRSCGCGSSFSV